MRQHGSDRRTRRGRGDGRTQRRAPVPSIFTQEYSSMCLTDMTLTQCVLADMAITQCALTDMTITQCALTDMEINGDCDGNR